MAARLITILNFISLAICTTFDTYCNRTLTGSFGEIRSPNYPDQYPANESCLWGISVNQDYDGIVLQFKKFLTRQSNKVSSDESLLIYTENPDVYLDTVPVRVLQGRLHSNFIFRSESTQLWLQFQSSSSVGSERNGELLGFDILYSVVTSTEECENPGIPENGIMIGSNFTVGFHVQYYCNHGYRLQGVYQLACVIRSISGQPEWSDPIPLCLNTCPALISEHLKFSGNNMTVNSTIDVSCDPPYLIRGASQSRCTVAQTGVLQWNNVPSCYIPDCTRPIVLNQYSGSIVNPSYPRNIVQGEKNCRWQIFGKPNTIIRVYFIYVDLPVDGESYLEIKDKGSRRSSVLMRVQGEGSDARNVTSRTNHVEIHYRGPRTNSTTNRGFYISYQNLPELPIVELEDEPHGPTRSTIHIGTITTTITSSRKPISSSTQVIRHPDNGKDTVKIAVGVSVPVVIGLIVVLGLYLWYRKKYPVRMIMGREFAKFCNPDYQVKSSTLTLVRDDADEFFHSNKAVSSLSLASEHQPTGTQYDNIGFQSDSEISRSLSREEEEEEDRKLMQRKSYLFTHRDSDFTDEKSSSSDSDSHASSPSHTQVSIEQHETITDDGEITTVDYENVILTKQKHISKSDLRSDDKEEKAEETATVTERHDDINEKTKDGRRASTFHESPMRRFSIDPSLSVRSRSQSVVVVGEYGLIDPRLAKYTTISESNHSGRARSMSVVVSGSRDHVEQKTNATNSDSSGSIPSQMQVGIETHVNTVDVDAEVPSTDYENIILTQQKNIIKSDEENINTTGADSSGSIPSQTHEHFENHGDVVDDSAELPSTDSENLRIKEKKYDSEQNINNTCADLNLSVQDSSISASPVNDSKNQHSVPIQRVSSSSNEDIATTDSLDASGQHEDSALSVDSKSLDSSMSSEQTNDKNAVVSGHGLISDDKTLHRENSLPLHLENRNDSSTSGANVSGVSTPSGEQSNCEHFVMTRHGPKSGDNGGHSMYIPGIPNVEMSQTTTVDYLDRSNVTDASKPIGIHIDISEQSEYENIIFDKHSHSDSQVEKIPEDIAPTPTASEATSPSSTISNVVAPIPTDPGDCDHDEYETIIFNKHVHSDSQVEKIAEVNAPTPTVAKANTPTSITSDVVAPIPTDPGDCDQDEYETIILHKHSHSDSQVEKIAEVKAPTPTVAKVNTPTSLTSDVVTPILTAPGDCDGDEYENIILHKGVEVQTLVPQTAVMDDVMPYKFEQPINTTAAPQNITHLPSSTDANSILSVQTGFENIPLCRRKTSVSDSKCESSEQCLDEITPHSLEDENYENVKIHHGIISLTGLRDDKQEISFVGTQSKGSSSHFQKDISRNEQLTSTPIDTDPICDATTNASMVLSETSTSLSKSENLTFDDRSLLSSSNSNQPVDTETNPSSIKRVVSDCLADGHDDSEKNPFENMESGNRSVMVTDLDDDSSLSSFNQSFLDSSVDASSTCSNSPYMEKKVLAVSEPEVQGLPKRLQAPVLDLSESTNDEYSSSDDDDNSEHTNPLGGIGVKTFPATAGVLQLPGITEEPDSETSNSNSNHDEIGNIAGSCNKDNSSVSASERKKPDDTDSSDEESLVKFTEEDILNALDSDELDEEEKQSESYTVNVIAPPVITIGTSDRYVFGEENDDIDV